MHGLELKQEEQMAAAAAERVGERKHGGGYEQVKGVRPGGPELTRRQSYSMKGGESETRAER